MDQVNHPSHYGGGDNPFEAIKVIEQCGLGPGFTIGSALKYICRAPHKGQERTDLEKAAWYLRYAANRGWRIPEVPGHAQLLLQVIEEWDLKQDEDLEEAIECIREGRIQGAANAIERHIETKLS